MCNFDESKSSIKTWIYSIARNSLIDFIRTKKDQNLELTDHIEDDQININLQANLAMNAQTLYLAFLTAPA